jgi:DNA helicase HerA-like ATPase
LDEIRDSFGSDDAQGQIGMRSFADLMIERLETGELPYLDGDLLRSADQLPFVNIVIEEAPSILNPQRMRFGSVFRDISRQGRKFGIGLTVISQQVSEIDTGVLTQLNTELTMALGNADERREAVRNASADLSAFTLELAVLERGQALVTTSFRDVALPLQTPPYRQTTS